MATSHPLLPQVDEMKATIAMAITIVSATKTNFINRHPTRASRGVFADRADSCRVEVGTFDDQDPIGAELLGQVSANLGGEAVNADPDSIRDYVRTPLRHVHPLGGKIPRTRGDLIAHALERRELFCRPETTRTVSPPGIDAWTSAIASVRARSTTVVYTTTDRSPPSSVSPANESGATPRNLASSWPAGERCGLAGLGALVPAIVGDGSAWPASRSRLLHVRTSRANAAGTSVRISV